MLHTQIELTSPDHEKQVWWIPVPTNRAKVGEKILQASVEWTITGVYTTLHHGAIPKGSRIADRFTRLSHTESTMSI